ncbi:MAG: hypothetical protein WCB94_04425 [Terriglobales bacterium]
MAVIAMTREMGTLGKDVVAGLAERLGLEHRREAADLRRRQRCRRLRHSNR